MSHPRPQNTLRRISTTVLIGALVLLAGFSITRTVETADTKQRQARAQTEDELRNLVTLWETLISERVTALLTELPLTVDLTSAEARERESVPWFEAWYLWRTAQGSSIIAYPPPTTEEDAKTLLTETACLRSAHRLQLAGLKKKAAAGFADCTDGSPPSQLLASDLAAAQSLAAGEPQPAVEMLMAASPPIDTPLRDAVASGLSPQRLLHRRMTLSTALDQLKRPKKREALIHSTISEVADLSGASLALLLPEAERLLTQLPPSDRGTKKDLSARLRRAQNRSAAYQAVQARLLTLDPDDTAGLRFVHDGYSDSRFFVVWTSLGGGRVGAVHIDVPSMLEQIVGNERSSDRSRQVVVLNAGGDVIYPQGVDRSGMTVLGAVPLGRMLPHLRAARLVRTDTRPSNQYTSLLLQFMPILVAIILVVAALVVQSTAVRRERELYQRQQDFMARVTHELKTPLAGIKVMAEALEMGAAADPESLQVFIRRTLSEAEKLEQRIEEVLVAAREPRVSATTPVALHELAETVVTAWQPRFKHAGARLEVDLKPCSFIPADPELLRDAMSNLLDNALKYRREGVRGVAQVRTGEMGSWVVFEVSDNGVGVPAHLRRAIFERFRRIEGHGRGKAGGHGLGLSFVADTAAAHGGLVECREGTDGGACFRLKLRRRR